MNPIKVALDRTALWLDFARCYHKEAARSRYFSSCKAIVYSQLIGDQRLARAQPISRDFKKAAPARYLRPNHHFEQLA